MTHVTAPPDQASSADRPSVAPFAFDLQTSFFLPLFLFPQPLSTYFPPPHSPPLTSSPSSWMLDAGMYEPLYLSFDAYPTVVPRVRVRGVMALFLAVSILWALIW